MARLPLPSRPSRPSRSAGRPHGRVSRYLLAEPEAPAGYDTPNGTPSLTGATDGEVGPGHVFTVLQQYEAAPNGFGTGPYTYEWQLDMGGGFTGGLGHDVGGEHLFTPPFLASVPLRCKVTDSLAAIAYTATVTS